jgi:hypothetical protein
MNASPLPRPAQIARTLWDAFGEPLEDDLGEYEHVVAELLRGEESRARRGRGQRRQGFRGFEASGQPH